MPKKDDRRFIGVKSSSIVLKPYHKDVLILETNVLPLLVLAVLGVSLDKEEPEDPKTVLRSNRCNQVHPRRRGSIV